VVNRRAVRACCHDRPGPPTALTCAHARRELGRVDAGGQDDADVGNRRGLRRTARADQADDPVERELRPYGGHADRQVGGEPEEPERAGSGRLVGVGADHQFDEGGIGHGGAGRAIPLDDRGGGDGEPVQQYVVQAAGRALAFQPHRADLLLVEGDRDRQRRGKRRRRRRRAVGSGADRPLGAVEADPGDALGQARGGAGEGREVHSSADQRVEEHDHPERAFRLRIQARQPLDQCLHGGRVRADRRANDALCATAVG
jgi:hypothetical protein